jgi:hypothetical protein
LWLLRLGGGAAWREQVSVRTTLASLADLHCSGLKLNGNGLRLTNPIFISL